MSQEKAKDLYVREATGLVKSVSPREMMIFNIIIPGFLSALWFPLAFNPLIFPSGNFVLGLLTLGVFGTFQYLVFSMLVSSFPRTGSDYVYTSRILHPSIGFASAFAGWIILQWWYNTFYGYTIAGVFVGPYFSALGRLTGNQAYVGMANFMLSTTGLSIVTYVIIALASLILVGGLKLYLKIQWGMFVLSILGIVALFAIFLTTSRASFISSFNSYLQPFTNSSNPYNSVISTAALPGASTDSGTVLYQTIGTWVIPWFYSLGFAMYGIFWVGEMRNAGAIKNQLKTVLFPFYVNIALWIGAWVGLTAMTGYLFWGSVSALGASKDPLAANLPGGVAYMPSIIYTATSNVPLMTVYMVGGVVMALVIVFGIFISVTRVLFAQGFDRVWPQRMASVDSRSRTPLYAMLVSVVGSLAYNYLALNYPSFGIYFVAIGVGMSVSFIITMASGVLFPYRRKDLFKNTPISKYKVGGVPLITVCGMVGIGFNLVFLYYIFTDSAIGFVNTPSLVFVALLFVAGVLLWFSIRAYRKRGSGFDIALAYKEIPPE